MMTHPSALLLCDDLIFTSRITGTAKSLGLLVRPVKTPAELLQLANQSRPQCIIIDLNTPGLEIDVSTRMLAGMVPKPFIVGYGSHVDTATLKRARDAGCDIVWPRSKFVDELATALPDWCKERLPPPDAVDTMTPDIG